MKWWSLTWSFKSRFLNSCSFLANFARLSMIANNAPRQNFVRASFSVSSFIDLWSSVLPWRRKTERINGFPWIKLIIPEEKDMEVIKWLCCHASWFMYRFLSCFILLDDNSFAEHQDSISVHELMRSDFVNTQITHPLLSFNNWMQDISSPESYSFITNETRMRLDIKEQDITLGSLLRVALDPTGIEMNCPIHMLMYILCILSVSSLISARCFSSSVASVSSSLSSSRSRSLSSRGMRPNLEAIYF